MARHIEPICRTFAVPHMATLTELERYLVDAGLLVEVIEDVSVRGNIDRNWELVDAKNMDGVRSFVPTLVMTTIKVLHNIAPGLLPPVLRILTDGGVALTEAARAGAFLIGHWRARKPAAARAMIRAHLRRRPRPPCHAARQSPTNFVCAAQTGPAPAESTPRVRPSGAASRDPSLALAGFSDRLLRAWPSRLPLTTSLHRAVAHLLSLQAERGDWEGEMVWCPMITAQYVIVQRVVGRPVDAATRAAIIRHFERTRTGEGAWGLHPESPGFVFVTALGYVALRLLGVGPESASGGGGPATGSARSRAASRPSRPGASSGWR